MPEVVGTATAAPPSPAPPFIDTASQTTTATTGTLSNNNTFTQEEEEQEQEQPAADAGSMFRPAQLSEGRSRRRMSTSGLFSALFSSPNNSNSQISSPRSNSESNSISSPSSDNNSPLSGEVNAANHTLRREAQLLNEWMTSRTTTTIGQEPIQQNVLQSELSQVRAKDKKSSLQRFRASIAGSLPSSSYSSSSKSSSLTGTSSSISTVTAEEETVAIVDGGDPEDSRNEEQQRINTAAKTPTVSSPVAAAAGGGGGGALPFSPKVRDSLSEDTSDAGVPERVFRRCFLWYHAEDDSIISGDPALLDSSERTGGAVLDDTAEDGLDSNADAEDSEKSKHLGQAAAAAGAADANVPAELAFSEFEIDVMRLRNVDQIPELDRYALERVAVSASNNTVIGIGTATSIPLQLRRNMARHPHIPASKGPNNPGPLHCFQTRRSETAPGVTRAGLLRSFESLRGISVSRVSCGKEHWLFLCCEDPEFSAASTSSSVEIMGGLSVTGTSSSYVPPRGQFTQMIFVVGSNDVGQLGLGPRLKRAAQPRKLDIVPATKDAVPVGVACGSSHSVVVCSDNSVLTFGRGSHGRLGHPHLQPNGTAEDIVTVPNLYKPRVVDYLRVNNTRISHVTTGVAHTLVLLERTGSEEKSSVTSTDSAARKNTMLFAFGRNTHGQCGSPDRLSDSWIPYLIGSLLNESIVDIAAGAAHSVAVTAAGDAFVFGDTSRGQCGQTTTALADGQGSMRSSAGLDGFTAVVTPTRMKSNYLIRSAYAGGDCTFFVAETGRQQNDVKSAESLASDIDRRRKLGEEIPTEDLLAVVDALCNQQPATPRTGVDAGRVVLVTGRISVSHILRDLHRVQLPYVANATIICERHHTAVICSLPQSAAESNSSFQILRSSQSSAEFKLAEFSSKQEFNLPSSEFLISAHACSLIFNDYCIPGVLFVCSQHVCFHGHYHGSTHKVSVNFASVVSVEKSNQGLIATLLRGPGISIFFAEGVVKLSSFATPAERDRAFAHTQRLWWPHRVMFKETRPKLAAAATSGPSSHSSIRDFAKLAVVGGRTDIRSRFHKQTGDIGSQPVSRQSSNDTANSVLVDNWSKQQQPATEIDLHAAQTFECLYSYEQLLQFDSNQLLATPSSEFRTVPPNTDSTAKTNDSKRQRSNSQFIQLLSKLGSSASRNSNNSDILPTHDVYGFAIPKDLQFAYFKWARQYARNYPDTLRAWELVMCPPREPLPHDVLDLFAIPSNRSPEQAFATPTDPSSEQADARPQTVLNEILPVEIDELLRDYNTTAHAKANRSASEPLPKELARFPVNHPLYRLVRKGIPSEYRGAMWFKLSGAEERMKRSGHYYSYLFRKQMQQQSFFAGAPNSRHQAESTSHSKHSRMKEVAKEIELDIRRTFSEDVLSSNVDWSDALRRILIAYAMRNPSLGYCQSMNILAGVCLMFMPEEHAFWTVTVVVEELLNGYFSKSMTGLLVDFDLFEERLGLMWPKLGQHLREIKFNLPVVLSKWFLCLFFGTLPTETSLHVWDLFFLEGQRWLFGVAAACFRGAMSVKVSANAAETPGSFLSAPSSASLLGTKPLMQCEDEFAAAMTVGRFVKHAFVDPHVLTKQTEEVLAGGFFNDSDYERQRVRLWREKHDQFEKSEERRAKRKEESREKHVALQHAIGEIIEIDREKLSPTADTVAPHVLSEDEPNIES